MKALILLLVVVCVGCASTSTSWVSDPSDPNNVIIEGAIRGHIKKRTGKLTKADLGKVTALDLGGNQLTEVPEGLEKLTQLKSLVLDNNPDLTKAQIAELKKRLNEAQVACTIYSNPTK